MWAPHRKGVAFTAASRLCLLGQPGENKHVRSSYGFSSLLSASPPRPCLPWVQRTVWIARHLVSGAGWDSRHLDLHFMPFGHFRSFTFVDICFMAQEVVHFSDCFLCSWKLYLMLLLSVAFYNWLKLVDSVVPLFYILIDFMSSFSVSYTEKSFEVSNYNFRVLYFFLSVWSSFLKKKKILDTWWFLGHLE